MCLFFFFNDTATTEIYTLSLHDALPIFFSFGVWVRRRRKALDLTQDVLARSEEHTSELQSQSNLVCRLLLEKKKATHLQPRPSLPPHVCTPREICTPYRLTM